jgi:hypothetical protein
MSGAAASERRVLRGINTSCMSSTSSATPACMNADGKYKQSCVPLKPFYPVFC